VDSMSAVACVDTAPTLRTLTFAVALPQVIEGSAGCSVGWVLEGVESGLLHGCTVVAV